MPAVDIWFDSAAHTVHCSAAICDHITPLVSKFLLHHVVGFLTLISARQKCSAHHFLPSNWQHNFKLYFALYQKLTNFYLLEEFSEFYPRGSQPQKQNFLYYIGP